MQFISVPGGLLSHLSSSLCRDTFPCVLFIMHNIINKLLLVSDIQLYYTVYLGGGRLKVRRLTCIPTRDFNGRVIGDDGSMTCVHSPLVYNFSGRLWMSRRIKSKTSIIQYLSNSGDERLGTWNTWLQGEWTLFKSRSFKIPWYSIVIIMMNISFM